MATGDDPKPAPGPAPRPVLWWESRTIGVQIAIAFPILLVAMFAFHRGFFPHLSLALDVTYAIFWGAVLTGLVVAATRNEARRRRTGGSVGERHDD